MTPPVSRRLVGMLTMVMATAVGLAVMVGNPAVAEARRDRPSVTGLASVSGGTAERHPPQITVPPVTLPPVNLPPVAVPALPVVPAVPPVNVPPLGGGLGTIGGVVDDTVGGATGTLNGLLGALTGERPDQRPSPPDPGGQPDQPGGSVPPVVGGSGPSRPGAGNPARRPSATTGGPEDRSGAASSAVAAERAAAATPAASLVAVDLAPGSVGPLDEAFKRDARRFVWPLLLGGMVVAFLSFQSRSERHERKLADAPLDQGERLRFR